MTSVTQTISARVDSRGVAVLEAMTAAVSGDELEQLVSRCHHDAEVRAVVLSGGLISALLGTARPIQKGFQP